MYEPKMYEPKWLDDIKDGENRIFGFLQFDIQGHSKISESVEDSKMQEIKDRLREIGRRTAYLYDGFELKFAGDGASYAFHTEQGSASDHIVKAGLHILHELPFFNDMLRIDELLQQSLILRLSCHRGEATFHKDSGLMHGDAMNKFLKHEREIGLPNSIAITEAVYNNLASKNLKERFEKSKYSSEVGMNLYKLRDVAELFTENYPARALHHNGGRAISDAEAIDQVAWYYSFKEPTEERVKLTYGHFVPLKYGPGKYEVRFRIKVDNNELSDDILEIWVGGSDDIVAESRRSYTKLSPSMFPEKDIYEEFPIEITYEGEEEMEYIIEALPYESSLDLSVWIDKIMVRKLD